MAPVTSDGPPPSPIIAIDIGNTRVKAGAVDPKRDVCVASEVFPTEKISTRLPLAITALLEREPGVTSIVIAGVVEHAVITAEDLLRKKHFRVFRLQVSTPLPLNIRYRTPATLGVDRLANAFHAACAYPDAPVIVIAAGTALVIDYVDNTTFFGGAILPGIRMQIESLHRATDALPLVDVYHNETFADLPAASTEECIAGGVVHGCAAAISGIIEVYRRNISEGRSPVILTTGGDWDLLEKYIRYRSIHLPEMTLIGIARTLPFLVDAQH